MTENNVPDVVQIPSRPREDADPVPGVTSASVDAQTARARENDVDEQLGLDPDISEDFDPDSLGADDDTEVDT